MFSLIAVLLSVVVIYFVQKYSPLLAGIVAVIPVKIIATAVFSYTEGGSRAVKEAIGGVLIGQFTVGFILLGIYFYLEG